MKELTESWEELGAKVREGDFEGIHVGDYKPLTLSTGEVVNMVVDSIHPCGGCGDQADGSHITFIHQNGGVKEACQKDSMLEPTWKVMGAAARLASRPPFAQLTARLTFPV